MAKPKYDTPEHRAERKRLERLVAAGRAYCVEPICLEELDGRTRWIPPNSQWHVPHNEDGVTYRGGAAHSRCNSSEGSRRWHSRLKRNSQPPRRWELP